MNKSEIITELRQTHAKLSQYIQNLSVAEFDSAVGDSWSPAGYLKHLILSNKPFAKGLNLPKDKLAAMFGEATQPSRSYEDLVATYKGRLAEGIKAESFDNVNPNLYRLPEGITDEKAYFVDTWNETQERLYAALENWDDADLDRYQLPHPAMNNLTIREMLYFTISHNKLHFNDIRALSNS